MASIGLAYLGVAILVAAGALAGASRRLPSPYFQRAALRLVGRATIVGCAWPIIFLALTFELVVALFTDVERAVRRG